MGKLIKKEDYKKPQESFEAAFEEYVGKYCHEKHKDAILNEAREKFNSLSDDNYFKSESRRGYIQFLTSFYLYKFFQDSTQFRSIPEEENTFKCQKDKLLNDTDKKPENGNIFSTKGSPKHPVNKLFSQIYKQSDKNKSQKTDDIFQECLDHLKNCINTYIFEKPIYNWASVVVKNHRNGLYKDKKSRNYYNSKSDAQLNENEHGQIIEDEDPDEKQKAKELEKKEQKVKELEEVLKKKQEQNGDNCLQTIDIPAGAFSKMYCFLNEVLEFDNEHCWLIILQEVCGLNAGQVLKEIQKMRSNEHSIFDGEYKKMAEDTFNPKDEEGNYIISNIKNIYYRNDSIKKKIKKINVKYYNRNLAKKAWDKETGWYDMVREILYLNLE